MKLFGSIITTAIIVIAIWSVAMLQAMPIQGKDFQATNEQSSVAQQTGAQPTKNQAIGSQAPSTEISEKKLTEIASASAKAALQAKLQTKPEDQVALKTQLKLSAIKITGSSQRLPLSNIDKLWQEFNQSPATYQALANSVQVIYVLYQNFDNNYQHADVTIGFANNKSLKTSKQAFSTQKTLINKGNYKTLLTKGDHGAEQLADAWQNIDFNQQLHSVVEVHYLSTSAVSNGLNQLNERSTSELLVSYK